MAADTTTLSATPDVQAGVPATQVSLSRVGVTGVEKVIRVKADGEENLYHADFECFVDLNPRQAGVHMSRFEEIVAEAIDEVVLGEAFKAEVLAAHIAQHVRERQGGLRAEVSVTARYPQTVTTPASGIETQEIYVLYGTAVDSEQGNRPVTGVKAQGMTACPCAQEMVAELGRERLAERGFSPEEVERAIEAVPVATHNQRGIGTLHIGCPEGGERPARQQRSTSTANTSSATRRWSGASPRSGSTSPRSRTRSRSSRACASATSSTTG